MNLTKIIKETFKSGGTSYNITTGKSTPKTGYMVSLYGYEETHEVSNILDPLLKNFINANSEVLSDEKSFVGTWYNKEDNKVYFDVSVNIEDLHEAITFGLENKQAAIYDCRHKSEIRI